MKKKRIAAIIAVNQHFQSSLSRVKKLMWTDFRSVGWMNKPRNK